MRVLVLVFWASGATVPAAVLAQSTPRHAILDVPYLPQTELLCGGAAAAMVMRYWGERGIQAESFASLVERDAGGIRTSALENALTERSWIALAGPGERERLIQQLQRGRPVIALIEDRPGRFHYVVIVGWSNERVVLHDPARAPFRVVDDTTFTRAWERANRWMMVLLPPAGRRDTPDVADSARTESHVLGACDGIVAEGVRLAQDGDRTSARDTLQTAANACPRESAAWREIAGLDALDGKWADAERDARAAVDRSPDDEHAWRILGTAAYLRNHQETALDAWNHLGEPLVDLVDVRGLERTRYAVVADAVDTPSGTLVTVDRLTLAERRTREVPALSTARVSFHPLENGRAQVDVGVAERPLAPSTPAEWSALALHALTERELAPAFASVTGGGELITTSWRWWNHRPRVGFSIAAPAPHVLGGGVWRVFASRETQTFGRVPFEEVRTSAGLAVSNWISARARVEAGATLDRWRGRERNAGLSAAIEWWPVRDRVAVDARGGAWIGSSDSFQSGGVQLRWQSSAAPAGSVWLANAGVQAASGNAPASLWPGADTGHARDILLRAHPLLDDGVITGGVFGRQLVFGGAEWRRWLRPSRWLLRFAPAAFVDIARASNGLPSSDLQTQVDAGLGARLALPGSGVLRIDLARGLRDGRTALTVGWTK
jgi:hypothetical protein